MPELRNLEISEVSLVDSPANAEVDPITGRKIARATVALFKRDRDSDGSYRKEEKKMEFTQVLKSATSREQVVAAVEGQAQRISKRDGIRVDAATVKAWTPEAVEKYEALPVGVVKRRERKMFKSTKAEAELDARARKRMKKSGVGYAKAVSQELEADPALYQQYEKEIANGSTFDVPEPVEYGDSDRMLNKRAKAKLDEDDDDDEYDDDDDDLAIDKCVTCKSSIGKGARFCSNCGSDLAKARTTRTKARI